MISNEFIRQLSLDDKKNLSQKALKTCEEVGELAKAVLPYESAPGTNHRFIDKYKILEEVADVYLTSMSIAYCLGFSDEEIEGMINQKSLKWSELLSRAPKKWPISNPSPVHLPNNCYFESHIGVSIYPNQKEDLSKFVEKEFNGKELGDHLNIKLKGIVKLSQNFFKKSIDGSKFINMITYRSTTSGSEEFKRYVDLIKQTLKAGGYEYEKVEVEYAIYDTNVSHDANWLKNLETVK